MNTLNPTPHPQYVDLSNSQQLIQYNTSQNQTNIYEQLHLQCNQIQKQFLEHLKMNKKIVEYHALLSLIQTLEQKYWDLSAKNMFNLNIFQRNNYELSRYVPKDMVDFAIQIGSETNTDIFSCILFICATTSIALRGRYRVRLNSHWSEMINLFFMLAKKSGDKKSALAEYGKKPIIEFVTRKRLMDEEQKKNQLNVKPSQISHIRKRRERDIYAEYKNEIHKNGEAQESTLDLLKKFSILNDELDQYMPKENVPAEIFCNVTTFVGLLQKLYKQGETIALFEAEGSPLFSKYFKENVFTTLLINAHGGEPYQYDSSTSRNKIELQNPSINTLILLQTELMEKLFSNAGLKDIGYLPRVLPFFASEYIAPDQALIYRRAEDHPDPSDIYSSKINKMLDFTYTQERHREIFEICCEEEAYYIIKNFENKNQQDIRDGAYPHMVSFIKKLHGHAVRLAGIIHCWNYPDPHKHPITEQEMKAGISLALIARDHANFAFNTELRNTRENAIKILKYLFRQDWARSKPIFCVTHILQYVGLKKVQCLPALDLLESCNIIRQHHEAGYGRICLLHNNLLNTDLNLIIGG